MPVVYAEFVKDTLTSDQRTELIGALTAAVEAVEGPLMRQPFVGVQVILAPRDAADWAVGGELRGSDTRTHITVKAIERVLDEPVKQQLIQGLLEAVRTVEGDDRVQGAMAIVEDNVTSGAWGFGGLDHGATTEEVREMETQARKDAVA